MIDKKISIVIPCYNSEIMLESIVKKCITVMENENYCFEIILIDDGSKDKTFTVIEKLKNNYSNILGIKFGKNFGQHAALIAGYSMTSGEIIVGLNDDGEQNPDDIPKLIKKLEEGYDYVCAKHDLKGHKKVNKAGSKINNWCNIHLLGQPEGFYFSSYYAMNRFLIDKIIENKNPFININGLILTITNKITDIDIPLYERQYGSSGYSLKKSLKLWSNTYTSYTIFPLRISIYFSFVLCIMVMITFIVFFITKSFYWLISCFVLILFALLFFSLSIIGEYIGRIFLTVNGYPQYIIEKVDSSIKK
ncbi:MAG: glycosyltransferase [Clostridium sp.]